MSSDIVPKPPSSRGSDFAPPAPNPGCPAAFVPGGDPLAGRKAALNCFIGRCGQPRLDPNQIRRDFCLKLQAWRHESGWSLDSLAAAIGVHPSTVSLWESGRRFPNLENLVALGTVMSAPPCHLFCPLVSARGGAASAAG